MTASIDDIDRATRTIATLEAKRTALVERRAAARTKSLCGM